MNPTPFDTLIQQFHDMASERKQIADKYDGDNPELASLMRNQAACYTDAATIVWAHARQYPCAGTPVSDTQNPS